MSAGGPKSPIMLQLRARFHESAFEVLAVVAPYTRADINHLEVQLNHVAAGKVSPTLDDFGSPLKADLLATNLEETITFTNLSAFSTYRVRALAYKAPGSRESDLISTQDSRSFSDVTIADDDRVGVILHVQLVDKPFNGEAKSIGIAVADGGFAYTGAPDVSVTSPPTGTANLALGGSIGLGTEWHSPKPVRRGTSGIVR